MSIVSVASAFNFLAILDLKSSYPFGSREDNLGLFYFIAFAMLLIILAFGMPSVRLGFDISYGVYLWHMIAINFLLIADMSSVAVMLTPNICMACISWFCVEAPRLKKISLKPKF